MANLESIVVDATSSALKVSLTAVEVALKERWRDGLRPQEEVNLAGGFTRKAMKHDEDARRKR